MYEAYFNLKERPFSISPDPRFFYLTAQHREALTNCQYMITNRVGPVYVHGDVGTGKTTIARRLYQQFLDDPQYIPAMIISPNLKSSNALVAPHQTVVRCSCKANGGPDILLVAMFPRIARRIIMDPTTVFCPNTHCHARGQTGQGNIGIHSQGGSTVNRGHAHHLSIKCCSARE